MRIVAVVLALACASPAHADPTIYKCERDGRITYSGTPCEGTTVKEFAPSTGSSPHDQAQVRLELELAGAITSGDLPRTTTLIANGADVRARDKDGVTPLHRAVAAGRVAIVELLIAKGAETDARSNEGVAPLHVAAMSDRAAVAEILIARGAEINARTRSGYTPLLCAAREGHLGLNVDVKSDQPLYLAAHMGDGELVKELIDHGADINYARHGETARRDRREAQGSVRRADQQRRGRQCREHERADAVALPGGLHRRQETGRVDDRTRCARQCQGQERRHAIDICQEGRKSSGGRCAAAEWRQLV